MITSFYTQEELANIGFKHYGDNVLISRKASIYSPENMIVGSNVRIDDFCILSGKLNIGSYIHISANCLLFGGNDGIFLEDYTAISSRSAIYAESDDYSGIWLTNPMLPDIYRNIIGGGVIIKAYSIVGSGCTILPGVVIGEGTAVGCMSLVSKTLEPWGIYAGIPCKKIKERKKDLLELVPYI